MVAVALSRVRSLEALQVLGFSRYCCLPPPAAVTTFARSLSMPLRGGAYGCCQVQHVSDDDDDDGDDDDNDGGAIEHNFDPVSIKF